MADPRGFLTHDRATAPLRPTEERVRDHREVHLPLAPAALRDQAARCMDCGVPFCHPSCPLGNLIPDWNDLVYRDRWHEALERLLATNNFPEFTGRLCPAPCEAGCVLGISRDPVTIKQVEHAIIDRGYEEGWVTPRPPARRSGFHVAVVGSGPAGLAAAEQLNRAGHRVTVLERDDRPGGLLRYGIPDFKLEKQVLDRRLALVQDEGVVFRTGVEVGRDLDVPSLRAAFDAVCLALGAGVPRDLPVPGRELAGVHFAMDYLVQQNRINAGETVPAEQRLSAAGRHVVILGGGDTGADCLGTAHRQGARSVVQVEILPRPPDTRPEQTPWPRWPAILRSYPAHEEGGRREWSVETRGFVGEGGRVTKLEAVRVAPGPPGADGRARLVEVPGSAFTLDADLVLLALGFVQPRHEGLLDALGVAYDPRGNVQTDGRYQTRVPGVFAAGDARRGQSLVVWAIAEGRQAAAAIDGYLMGKGDR